MKSVSLFFKNVLPLFLALITVNAVYAQSDLPVCSGTGASISTSLNPNHSGHGIIYVLGTNGIIHKMNVGSNAAPVPTSISVPTGSTALTVSRNLNGSTVTPTFYTTASVGIFKYLHYYNGTTWINTGSVMNADNLAAGGGFIFGLNCSSGDVYRSSGVGFPVPVVNIGNVGTCDIAADCSGNFYIINQVDSSLRTYSSTGTLLYRDTLKGVRAPGGQGLAVASLSNIVTSGNSAPTHVFYDGSDGNMYQGLISHSTRTVQFSAVAPTGTPFATVPVADFGNCGEYGAGPGPLGPGITATDTVRLCGVTTNVHLEATLGSGNTNWRVLSGPAVIFSSNGSASTGITSFANITNLNATSIILHNDPDCSGVNALVDTTVIIVTRGVIDAGPDHTIFGCRGIYADTLHGSLTDTTAGISYAIDWISPLPYYVCCQTTLDPIIAPVTDTTFVMTVYTLDGCVFKDSVRVRVADSTPKANFSYSVRLGCKEDTVKFINTTPTSVFINSVNWDFGDTTYSTLTSPVHIYEDQGIYNVVLAVANSYCVDTIRKYVNVLHPLIASFDIDDSTGCANQRIIFTNTSTATILNNIGTTFFYTFGDGGSSTLASPTHDYTRAGNFVVRLIIGNGLGCFDTAYRTIVVDSIPYVKFITADSSICEGQSITLAASYLHSGNTGITYNLTDGTIFNDIDNITYSFAQAGEYNVTLTAHYRICPDAVYTQKILVHPFPGVNIGPDTVLCPNGSPIVLSDRINIGNPAAKFLWSTGDTTASINAKDIGTFWARVTLAGCSGTDSILVNKDCYVDIPNVFTPNGDGSNDYFLPRQFLSRSLNSFKMSIFNRWGQVIYESSSLNGRGWDGRFNDKPQPQGVYVYIIDVSFENGVREHYTGNVTLLR